LASAGWWRLGHLGVDPLGYAAVGGCDQVEVAPPGVAVVRDVRAAGAQRARDAVGAAAGHDGVVVALDDQRRRAQPERCGVIGRQDRRMRSRACGGPVRN
jgi:hypothetical protein